MCRYKYSGILMLEYCGVVYTCSCAAKKCSCKKIHICNVHVGVAIRYIPSLSGVGVTQFACLDEQMCSRITCVVYMSGAASRKFLAFQFGFSLLVVKEGVSVNFEVVGGPSVITSSGCYFVKEVSYGISLPAVWVTVAIRTECVCLVQHSYLKNISAFLSACKTKFKIKDQDLFNESDLYDVDNFKKVCYIPYTYLFSRVYIFANCLECTPKKFRWFLFS